MQVKLSQIKLFTSEQLASLSRKDLLVVAETTQAVRLFLEAYVHELEEKVMEIEGKFYRIQAKVFSPSTEKSPSSKKDKESNKAIKPRVNTPKLPSERYPNAEIIEKDITCEQLPECKCCGSIMLDSGMAETSEYLTVIPKKYIIVRQNRHKYRCKRCHGNIATTPAIPRVIPGSSYSDELIVDATLSKFCDLIPMERYCQMAKRQGFAGIPPQSLIGASFKLAEFFKQAYERLRTETLDTSVLLADETPHRMLEGDERKGWYLWGFLNKQSCFYECHDTRSGDVAFAVLQESNCDILLTDVYAGYKKAVRQANIIRAAKGLPLIRLAYCNSHARRGFLAPKGSEGPLELQFMIDGYQEIYRLEAQTNDLSNAEVLHIRQQMRPNFEAMKAHAVSQLERFSSKSGEYQAFNYFLKNYSELTLFLTNPNIPIDNNSSERILRSPVVGRKTWYGTHSPDGAAAAAIHFSLIESCKLIGINPRLYYTELIKRIHFKQPILTPKELLAHCK